MKRNSKKRERTNRKLGLGKIVHLNVQTGSAKTNIVYHSAAATQVSTLFQNPKLHTSGDIH